MIASRHTVTHQLRDVLGRLFHEEQRLIIGIHCSRRALLVVACVAAATALSLAACSSAASGSGSPRGRATAPADPAAAASPIVLSIRNNHPRAYRGPVHFRTTVPDGRYDGPGAQGEVREGVARVFADVGARASIELRRAGALRDRPFGGGFVVTAKSGALALRSGTEELGGVDIGLVVIPGTSATVDDAMRDFKPLGIEWREERDGTLRGSASQDGYAIDLVAHRYGDGALDITARLKRAGPPPAPGYVALVRRVHTPGVSGARLRFNGRAFDGASSPAIWDRDFWYTRGVDWLSWRSGPITFVATSGFTPVPTIERNGRWVEGSHFYVWERTRGARDDVYLISEIAGPNLEQARSREMAVTPYAPMRSGDALELSWRLAVRGTAAPEGWEESHLSTFAGHRAVRQAGDTTVVDIGVPHVTFGTSYFPYSTLTENFDYYRTAGLDRETFWAFSPTLWAKWRELVPRMRGDLHIVKAMGFERVRLHHLELLQKMDRAEALAFLDFYMSEARALGLGVLIDSEGPDEWLGLLAKRYADILVGVELENEVLIGSIKPGDAERWTRQYRTVKENAPKVDVFLSAAGNNGMFERLRAIGVPFDRVGLHAYKHGPQWKEAYNSHALGTAGYASSISKTVTLAEFNWKELTLMSPPERRPHYAAVFEAVLSARAIPDIFEFQLQESMSFNPAVAGTNTRHYEPLTLDRRPKPEAAELLRVIREYGPPDAPVSVLPIEIGETRIVNGRATVAFTIANRGRAPVDLRLSALAFDGLTSRLVSPASVRLAPGARHAGRVQLETSGTARPGVYHHFVRADYGGRSHVGWGVASLPGAPSFDAVSPLADRVRYAQGRDILGRIDWSRPLAIAYGEKASVLEVETAYQLLNTLQSATGKYIWLSNVAALPDSLLRRGTVVMIGTPATHSDIAAARAVPANLPAKNGIVVAPVSQGRYSLLILAGNDKEGAQAAAADVLLRFWKNAKDATSRLSGLERGAALGNRREVLRPDAPPTLP